MTFETSRHIAASPEQVFAAFTDAVRLARWWGPAGFTNTFDTCQFEPGGRWSFVMHGPNGAQFRNESTFAEIVPMQKVVIDHISEPKYRLTITLAPSAGGTNVSWVQVFERADVAKRIEHIVVPPGSVPASSPRWAADACSAARRPRDRVIADGHRSQYPQDRRAIEGVPDQNVNCRVRYSLASAPQSCEMLRWCDEATSV